MSPTGEQITFLEPPLDADNFWPYCPRPCGPFRLLKSSIWSKWFSQKNNFGTFRHFGFPRGKIFSDRSKDRWPLMIFIKVNFAATGFPSWWKWPLIRSLINQRWKKPKKTQKNPTKWIFPEKRQQEKVLRICSSICVQIFSQIQWFIFEIVSGAPLIGVCNRWYDGLGSGPLPRLAKFFWGLICPDHLALEAKQTTRRRQGGGELVVEEEMKMHELLNYGVERYQHTKMLGYSSVWGKTDIRHSG